MGSVYRRKDSAFWWLGFVDAGGKPCAKSSQTTDRRVAEKTLADIETAIAAGRLVDAGPQTFAAYAVAWCTERGERRDEEKVWGAAKELGWLRRYVFPVLGHMKLGAIRPRDVRGLVKTLKVARSKRTKEQLAPRSIRNILGVVSALFNDAVADELIDVSPYVLKSGDMPAIVDKNPDWRDDAVYTRDEVEQLISDERLPFFHRVWWALGFFTGMRGNEVAALKQSSLVTTETPLQQLKVRQSYNPEHKRLKGTKTNRPRLVPVHPTLAFILAEWTRRGWAELNGRPPTPDDLLLTNSKGRRMTDSTTRRSRPADLEKLGLRHRGFHDARATLITLGTGDGAEEVWLERVTHNAKGKVFNQYRRRDWLKMCEAVACLKISLRPSLRSPEESMEDRDTTEGEGSALRGIRTVEPSADRSVTEEKADRSPVADTTRRDGKGAKRSDVATADMARRARLVLLRYAGGGR